MKSISVLGCGWFGLPFAKQMVQAGYLVNGSTTSTDKLASLKEESISSYLIDVHDLDTCDTSFFDTDILVVCLTGKVITSFEKLIDIINQSRIRKVIFTSSTSVYDNCNCTVDESTPKNDKPLSQIEDLFLDSKNNFEATIVRFAGLFGYNRKPGNFFPKSGAPMRNPEGYINLIHQDDCVAIVKQIIEQGLWGEIFNLSAPSHPSRREFYSKEKAKLHTEKPLFDEHATNEYKIVSSEKIVNALDYKFIYGDLMKY